MQQLGPQAERLDNEPLILVLHENLRFLSIVAQVPANNGDAFSVQASNVLTANTTECPQGQQLIWSD